MKTFKGAKDQFKSIGVDIGQGKYYEEMIYGIGLAYVSMINVIEGYLKEFNLSPTDMNVLMLVKHQGKNIGISQVDLGQKLMVTAHNMTRAVQKLEKRGLLKRVVDRKDARVNRVRVSAQGSHLLDQIWPGYDEILRRLANKIPQADQKALAALIQNWLRNKES